jgi:hypothetical protein
MGRDWESPAAYALCYKCHDRGSILSDATFPHKAHVVDSQTSCATCHDSHGVSSVQGNATSNAHLVSFDVSVVRPNAKGARSYTAGGPRSGTCALSCHGKEHDEMAYSPAVRSLFNPRRRPAGR